MEHMKEDAKKLETLKKLMDSLLDELKSGKAKEVYYPEHTQKWVDGLLSDYLLRKTMFESRPIGNIQTTLG